MKIKEYLNSLVSRRKSSASSKSDKSKSHHSSISSTDCHYEICGYEDPNKILINDYHSRTQILLNRHAQLVNTIVGIRSQRDNSCSHHRISHQSNQKNLSLNHNYLNTLATCNPHRECQYHQTGISSSNNSLAIKARQRSKIRTNPWIKTTQISQPDYSIYDPTISSGLIHSESFPQTISNGNIHLLKPSNIILHQSDSGQGFSLSSSKAIESSSTDNTSSDGPLFDEKQHVSYKKHVEQYYPPKTNLSDNKRKGKNRYQHPSNTRISSPKRSSINHNYQACSSSPRLHNDHFSIEFEEIVENERLHKQRSPTRNSPFILPLDETDVKLSSTSKLKKTNSYTILEHIEEIENEIRMIKNLNFDTDEQILSSNIYSNEDEEQQSIHEQVDQWIDECLTTSIKNPTTRLQNECDRLSNTIKDYVVCVYSNHNHQTSSLPKPEKNPELMTAFYLSSIPTTKRAISLINQPLQLLNSQTTTTTKNFKSIHECPF